MEFFHQGMRDLQDRYEGRAVADRLEANRMRHRFSETDRAFIENASFFFLATASEESVDCSFKGGDPGFVRILGENQLAWPDFDGNRMYRSLGNIAASPRVGLLFISFDGKLFDGAGRLRINGRAEVVEDATTLGHWPGAKRAVLLTADHIFFNCPRYIPKLAHEEDSIYLPREGEVPPEPPWKARAFVKDIFDAEKAQEEDH